MRRGLLAVVVVLVLVASASACDFTGAPGGVRVSVMGESIACGAEAQLRQDIGEERQVNTVLINHRWISDMQVALPDVVNDPDLRVLVVQLGVNDTAEKNTLAQIRAAIRRFLQTAAPRVECIWWLDITETGVINGNPIYLVNAPSFNEILRQEAALFPNVHVAPYDAWARAHPQYLWDKDRLHLNDAGRAPYAAWVENELVNAC